MDFVRDGQTDHSIAPVVDPETVATRTPTTTDQCGSTAGAAAHTARGERRCQDCNDAANQARDEWNARKEEAEDAEREKRAADMRPSLAVILLAHGVHNADQAIESLARHGYGDYADALELAAKECPVGTTILTNGGSVRAWLRGRAMLIQKKL